MYSTVIDQIIGLFLFFGESRLLQNIELFMLVELGNKSGRTVIFCHIFNQITVSNNFKFP